MIFQIDVCAKLVKCPKCKEILRISPEFPTHKERLKAHTCYAPEGVCKKDKKIHSYLTDLCKMGIYKLHENNPKLGVLTGVLKNVPAYECSFCQENKLCDIHSKLKPSSKSVPNIVLIGREKSERGVFEWKEFGDLKTEGTKLDKTTRLEYAASSQPISDKAKKVSYGSPADMVCQLNFEKLAEKFPENALVDFLDYALRRASFLNTTFLTSSEMMECLFPLYDYIQEDSVIHDPKNIKYMEIGHLKFINLYAFCAVKEPIPSSFCPLLLNTDDRKEMNKIPDINYYFLKTDSQSIREAKKIFYESIYSADEWQFADAMRKHLKEESNILLERGLKVQDAFHKFQKWLQEATKVTHPMTSVFSYPTLIHHDFTLFLNYCIGEHDIYEVKYPNTGPPIGNCSPMQMMYERWLEYTKNTRVIGGMIDPNGCQKFKENISADAYVPSESMVYEFEGCAPFKNCYQYENCRNPSPNAMTPKKKRTSKEREKFLKDKYKIKTEYMEECRFRDIMETEESKEFVRIFKEKYELPSGLKPKRSIQREAAIGGMNDTFVFDWSKDASPGTDLHNLDYNSMYSDVAMRESFPQGKYEIILDEEKIDKLIQCKENKFIFKNDSQNPVKGTMMVDILPPKDLLYPYLPIRTKQGKLVRALCTLCVLNNRKMPCNHKEEERMIRQSTYTIDDINYSLELGYK